MRGRAARRRERVARTPEPAAPASGRAALAEARVVRRGAAGARGTSDPIIPPVNGDCPTFATGTVTVAGLAGISLQVGPKSQGTGPLLFYWHGTGSQATEVNALVPAAVRQEILSQGGIIVSFQGSLGTGGDCSGTATFSRDDFKVADQIAACAVRDYGIDPRRIFTTGCSAGGLQAGAWARCDPATSRRSRPTRAARSRSRRSRIRRASPR